MYVLPGRGYSTINFFAPMTRYASGGGGCRAAALEFKEMVRQCHAKDIQVCLLTPKGASSIQAVFPFHPHLLPYNTTSFYGSSCANKGKDALNTPEYTLYCILYTVTSLHFTGPVPVTARMHSTPQGCHKYSTAARVL